jgi:hypothetical protein
MYTTTISWFLSSNPEIGNVQTSSNGSLFTVQLQEPFVVPRNASNITCELQQAIVWNSTINVVRNVNDRFYYSVAAQPQSFVVIPEGNYDIHLLSETINTLVENAPVPVLEFSIQLSLRGAYTDMTLYYYDSGRYISQVQFGLLQDIGRSLGFLPQIINFNPVIVGASESFVSDEASKLKDGSKSWLLSSSLVARGVRVNDRYDAVLAKINFNATPPGSQLVYTPPRPNIVPSDFGPGRLIETVTSYLTDSDTGLAVSTNGEYWSYVVVLKYDQPLYNDVQEGSGKKRKVGAK